MLLLFVFGAGNTLECPTAEWVISVLSVLCLNLMLQTQ